MGLSFYMHQLSKMLWKTGNMTKKNWTFLDKLLVLIWKNGQFLMHTSVLKIDCILSRFESVFFRYFVSEQDCKICRWNPWSHPPIRIVSSKIFGSSILVSVQKRNFPPPHYRDTCPLYRKKYEAQRSLVSSNTALRYTGTLYRNDELHLFDFYVTPKLDSKLVKAALFSCLNP